MVPNQKIKIPEFEVMSSKRLLVAMKDIDVTQSLVSMQYEINNPEAHDSFSYSVSLQEWTPLLVQFQFNFSQSSAVSQGDQLDRMFLKIIDPTMFVSDESNLPLDPELQNMEHLVFVPK